MKIKLTFDPLLGTPFRDGETEEVVKSWLELEGSVDVLEFTTGTQNIITELRVAVAKKLIEPENITFFFEDKVINFKGFYSLDSWPVGFCSHEGDKLRIIAMSRKEKI